MFMPGMDVSMKLIALGVGVGFVIWSMKNPKGSEAKLARYTGYFIALIALFTILLAGMKTVKMMSKGCPKSPEHSMKWKKY